MHKGEGVRPRAVSSLIELELRGKKLACSSPQDEAIGIEQAPRSTSYLWGQVKCRKATKTGDRR